MRIVMTGLGRMGANMARRLCRGGIEVIGINRTQSVVDELAAEVGVIAATSREEAVEHLATPRVVWLMLPCGGPTEEAIEAFSGLLDYGDILVDGGNSNYHETQRRAGGLAAKGIHYVDAGTSGGVWGLNNGYCMMVGGEAAAIDVLKPVLQTLAPAPAILPRWSITASNTA